MTDEQLYTLIGYIMIAHSLSTERPLGSIILAIVGSIMFIFS